MIRPAVLALLLAQSCEEQADPCDAMCESAAALYGGCLADWGLGWEAAGYEDERDYRLSCETWAWEMRRLEEDAGEEGATDGLCRDRADLFEGGECEDYTGTDWSAPS